MLYFNALLRIFMLASLALLPSLAFGQDSGLDTKELFARYSGDKSIEYLGQIFGSIGSQLGGPGNALIADIFRAFNIGVLTLGSIILGYNAAVSTLQTAQEGEVMGKKWSSFWVPLRSMAGIMFLIPTSTGYSLIQVSMMWVILQGVDAGNAVFRLMLDNLSQGVGLNTKIELVGQGKTTTEAIFDSLLCQYTLNYSLSYEEFMDGRKVEPYQYDNETWMYGVEGDSGLAKVCGGATVSDKFDKTAIKEANWISWSLLGIQDAERALDGYAREAFFSPNNSSNWSRDANVIEIGKTALATMTTVKREKKPPGKDQDYIKQARINGWLFTGSYYHALVGGDGTKSYSPPEPVLAEQNTLPPHLNLNDEVSALRDRYLAYTDALSVGAKVAAPKSEKEAGNKFTALVTKPFQDTVFPMIDNLTSSDGDPIVKISGFGTGFMQAVEVTLFGVLLPAVILLLLGACWNSIMSPGCKMATTFISMVIPAVMFMLAMFWSMGLLLGLYVPLIPYLVYTLAALAWFIMVIEAIVAAPIVALGVMSPASDPLGRASPAVNLLANIFLRPPLMVIGFALAIALLRPALLLINSGFVATVDASVPVDIGLFGTLGLLIVYGGLVVTLVNEVFSLIHVLPDKAGRWIGGQVEQSSVGRMAGQLEQSQAKAAKTTGSMIKGGAAALGGISAKIADAAEQKKDTEDLKEMMKNAKELSVSDNPDKLGQGGKVDGLGLAGDKDVKIESASQQGGSAPSGKGGGGGAASFGVKALEGIGNFFKIFGN